MYDASGTASPDIPAYRYNVNPITPNPAPPLWSGYTQYHPGMVVWHRGSLWRCEVPHLSDSAGGAPDSNMHLWTPVSSTTPYGQNIPQPIAQGFDGSYQAYTNPTPNYSSNSAWTYSHPPSPNAGPSTQPNIIAPQPESVYNSTAQHPLPGGLTHSPERDDADDSSPDSQGTVTASSPIPRGFLHSKTPQSASPQMSTAQFFTSKADESLRFLMAKQEGSKALEEDEWKDELKGKRVWRVGGLGMWAYDLNPGVEERKAARWRKWGEKGKGRQDWLDAARERTAFYEKARGVTPLVRWKLVQPSSGLHFPPDALQIGHDGGSVLGHPLFSARAWHEGGLHPGKAGPHLQTGCCISYGGAEVLMDTYEVLCAKPDPTLLKWVCFRHGESVRVEGWQPVEGGRERDGQSLFVAKGEWEGGEHPGKCRITDDHAHIGWGGGEVWIRPFYVLAYNNAARR